MHSEHIHFITGRLAQDALNSILPAVAEKVGFHYSVQVLPITVAALLTPKWVAPRLEIPPAATRIMLPGHCDGDLSPIHRVTDLPIEVGPKDLRQLPEYFGQQAQPADLSTWDIEIIAEINHAPRLSLDEILKMAESMIQDGANLIDVGCEPNSTWSGVSECVRALKDQGYRVSIDSLNPSEIGPAVAAGAELVLSVNSTNCQAAADWGCEVVAIPDDVRDLNSIVPTLDRLRDAGVPFRIDPILEPIGMGFAVSLQRYFETRSRWPDSEMMMGIGNISELTDVDSAGVNYLLLAICQELKIHSVLTTQVINWAQTAVRECDLARRLVHYANHQQVPAKHLSTDLVMLRDPKVLSFGAEHIATLAANVKDRNYRIFAENGTLHVLGNGQYVSGTDPFEIFDALFADDPGNIDASHAFYLGYELCKALTALQLSKQYTQDQSLDWGFLTVAEPIRHRLKRRTDREHGHIKD